MRWFRSPFLNLQVSSGTFVQQTSFKCPTLCHYTIIFQVIRYNVIGTLAVLTGRMCPLR